MKLMVDEMLLRLGRWLRAAGYDTEIASSGLADREILRQAASEDRKVITRDRKMMEFKEAEDRVLVLSGNHLHDSVRQLSEQLGIDWLHAPFSRCMLCNTPLQAGGKEYLARIPYQSRIRVKHVYFCPRCSKPFWHGGHVKRMQAKLQSWMDK